MSVYVVIADGMHHGSFGWSGARCPTQYLPGLEFPRGFPFRLRVIRANLSQEGVSAEAASLAGAGDGVIELRNL